MATKQEALPTPALAAQTEPAMMHHAFHYSPLRFLRAMLAIAWSAFAHPFSSTVIDLDTGRVRHEERG
jgi:hypothetical protein